MDVAREEQVQVPVEKPVLIKSPEHALELLGFTKETLNYSASQLLKILDTLDDKSLVYTYLASEPSEPGKTRWYTEFKKIQKLANKCAALKTSDDPEIQRLNNIHFLTWLKEIKIEKATSTFSKSLAYFIYIHFKVLNETPENPDHKKMSQAHLSALRLQVSPDNLALSASEVAPRGSVKDVVVYNATRFFVQPNAVELYTKMMPGVYLAKHPRLAELDKKILIEHPKIKLFVIANRYGEEKNALLVRMTTLQDLQDRGIAFVKLGDFKDYSAPHAEDDEYTPEELVELRDDIYCAGRRAQIALENKEEVVFHCKKGKGRSAQVYGIFRLAILGGIGIDELWAEMKQKRPGVDPLEKNGKETGTKKAVMECVTYINENREKLEAYFQNRFSKDFERSQAAKVIVIGGDGDNHDSPPPLPSREGRRSLPMRNSMGSSSE